METIDKEIKYWCGTSWHGDYIISTVEELRTIFGPPDLVGGKTDKVQFEWLLDLEVSNSLGTSARITLYDWKEYRKYDEDEVIRFHIGGFSGRITELAKREIEKLIEIFTNND
tara:strand:- start:37 stop:375 length:339 start_codon:yes stop_codon:yes gene_type:complete